MQTINGHRHRVAVIGAGPGGLAAIKSLLEEGFQVTGFERRSEPGGVWSFSDDPLVTSVTRHTSAQFSKFSTPFSDFPHTDEHPLHSRGTALGEYYKQYAQHFRLDERIRFNTTVTSITHHDDEKMGSYWVVSYYQASLRDDNDSSDSDEQCNLLRQELFDRIVYAVGSETVAKYPVIEGLDKFEGRFLHGQAFKGPDEFRGLNVIVIGQGNSGADCAVELSRTAKVYFSHRRPSVILPRVVGGARFDKAVTWQAARAGYWVNDHLPRLGMWLTDRVCLSAMRRAWGDIEPEFRLQPGGENDQGRRCSDHSVLINDDLIPALRAGQIHSVHGVRRVVSGTKVELEDGSVLGDIDAIIACTGYRTDFDLLGGAINFTYSSPKDSHRVPPQPDLYQNIFSLSYPDSLACLNYITTSEHAAGCAELASMAIAQVWSGKMSLPCSEKMQSWVRDHQSWFASRCLKTPPVSQHQGMVRTGPWLAFVHSAAGTGLFEHLSSFTMRGLAFAVTRPRMFGVMILGVNTPHMWRFFETGRRRAWEGAEEAILHAND